MTLYQCINWRPRYLNAPVVLLILPIVCSSINKAGYLMHPGIAEYESALATKPFRPMAMSILASGAVPPKEAVEYDEVA